MDVHINTHFNTYIYNYLYVGKEAGAAPGIRSLAGGAHPGADG